MQEHSIERYRVCGDRLIIPGIDGLKEQGPDGIVFGNLYIREKGYSREISSLPQALHVYDVAEFGGRLFVRADTSSTLVSSDDGGLSWRSVASDRDRPEGDLVPFAGVSSSSGPKGHGITPAGIHLHETASRSRPVWSRDSHIGSHRSATAWSTRPGTRGDDRTRSRIRSIFSTT